MSMIAIIFILIIVSLLSDKISKFFFKDMSNIKNVVKHVLLYFILFISMLATALPAIPLGLVIVMGLVNSAAHYFVDYLFEHKIKKSIRSLTLAEEITIVMILIITYSYIIGF